MVQTFLPACSPTSNVALQACCFMKASYSVHILASGVVIIALHGVLYYVLIW